MSELRQDAGERRLEHDPRGLPRHLPPRSRRRQVAVLPTAITRACARSGGQLMPFPRCAFAVPGCSATTGPPLEETATMPAAAARRDQAAADAGARPVDGHRRWLLREAARRRGRRRHQARAAGGDPLRRRSASGSAVDPVAGSPLFQYLHSGQRSAVADLDPQRRTRTRVASRGHRPISSSSPSSPARSRRSASVLTRCTCAIQRPRCCRSRRSAAAARGATGRPPSSRCRPGADRWRRGGFRAARRSGSAATVGGVRGRLGCGLGGAPSRCWRPGAAAAASTSTSRRSRR